MGTAHGYRHVGPAVLAERARRGPGVITVTSARVLARWLAARPTEELSEPFTFVVSLDGQLRLAPSPMTGNDPEGAPEPVFVGMAGTRRRGPQKRPLIPRTLVRQPASVRVARQGASVVRHQQRCYDRPDDPAEREDSELEKRLIRQLHDRSIIVQRQPLVQAGVAGPASPRHHLLIRRHLRTGRQPNDLLFCRGQSVGLDAYGTGSRLPGVSAE